MFKDCDINTSEVVRYERNITKAWAKPGGGGKGGVSPKAQQTFKSWSYFRPQRAILYTLFQAILQISDQTKYAYYMYNYRTTKNTVVATTSQAKYIFSFGPYESPNHTFKGGTYPYSQLREITPHLPWEPKLSVSLASRVLLYFWSIISKFADTNTCSYFTRKRFCKIENEIAIPSLW